MLKIIITGPESCGKTTLARQLSAHFQTPLVEEYARIFFEEKQTPQYNAADLLKIAMGQSAAEKQAERTLLAQFPSKKASNSPNLILCDTDLLTIKIWSEEKYGRCDPWIIERISDFRSHCETRSNQISSNQSAKSSNVKRQTSNTPFQTSSFKLQTLNTPLQTSNFKGETIYLLCSPESIAWEADPLRENARDRDRLFAIYEKNLTFHKKNCMILRGGIDARFEEARRLIDKVTRLLDRQMMQ